MDDLVTVIHKNPGEGYKIPAPHTDCSNCETVSMGLHDNCPNCGEFLG